MRRYTYIAWLVLALKVFNTSSTQKQNAVYSQKISTTRWKPTVWIRPKVYSVKPFLCFLHGTQLVIISPSRCLLDAVTACLISALQRHECSVSYIRLLPLQIVANIKTSFLQEIESRLRKPYLVTTSSSLLLTDVLQTQGQKNLQDP
jgi:hypothetical protein